jgi:hypothetical protein
VGKGREAEINVAEGPKILPAHPSNKMDAIPFLSMAQRPSLIFCRSIAFAGLAELGGWGTYI